MIQRHISTGAGASVAAARQPVASHSAACPIAPELAIAARLTARLSRCTAHLVPRLARAAMLLMRTEGWKPLCFASAGDFACERLDRSGSWLRQLARLGQACQDMPTLADALTGTDAGTPLSRAAAYEICRVARPENVAAWIHQAREGTIRDLKQAIQRHRNTGPSDVSAEPMRRAQDSLVIRQPAFLPGAFHDIERAFRATNPGSGRWDLLEALTAEHASGGAGMIDVGGTSDSPATGEGPSATVSRAPHRRVPHRTDRSARKRPDRRLQVVSGNTEATPEPNTIEDDARIDGLDTTNRELLQARWTLHRVQLFVDATDLESDVESAGEAASRQSAAEHLAQSMSDILALEHEIRLRIDRLLLWLDHRRAWSLLGYADAVGFGLEVLDESPATTRNRLRLARALERSIALQRGAESGRVSHQRLVRLAQLMQKRRIGRNRLTGANEEIMTHWVEHSERVRLKRLNEDLDAVARRPRPAAYCGSAAEPQHDGEPDPEHNPGHQVPDFDQDPGQDPGPGPGPGQDDSTRLPPPPSDTEWQASLRLVPGEARRRLLMGALHALASDPPLIVCQRFTAPADTIRDLRHSLNVTRVQLAEQALHLVPRANIHKRADPTLRSALRPTLRPTLGPADESRLFPSIRLAARHVERGTPIPDWICLLSLLEEFVEEWDNPSHMPRRPTDAIAARDGWRCTAPGCTSREIEVHHIVYRSHGGSDDPGNLTSLCPFHHRMGEHGGLLKVTGTAPLHLRWQIGDQVFVNERLVSERR